MKMVLVQQQSLLQRQTGSWYVVIEWPEQVMLLRLMSDSIG